MIIKTKIFTSGGSQAVRIPKEFRFQKEKEVYIKKIGDVLILIPPSVNIWEEFFSSNQTISFDI